MKIYTIWDNVKEEAGSLNLAKNDEEAIRQFRMGMEASNKTPGFNKNDYELFSLGSYDPEEMKIGRSKIRKVVIHLEKINE